MVHLDKEVAEQQSAPEQGIRDIPQAEQPNRLQAY
jgi:hypothetical protein